MPRHAFDVAPRSSLVLLCALLLLVACTQSTPPEPELDPASLNLEPTSEGWTPLFNGRDLEGWYTYLPSKGRNRDPQGVFKVQDGLLHVLGLPSSKKRQEFGYLATRKSYGDYHLRFQYRWGDQRFAPRENLKRDSGLMYHLTGSDRVWPRSLELQVQEGDTGDFWLLGGTTMSTTVASRRVTPKRFRESGTPYRTRAGKYVRVVKSKTRDNKRGWNTVELIVRGDEAVHLVNGEIVNRGQGLRSPGGAPLTRGRIAFQAEGAEIYYRNIEIRSLKPSAEPEVEAPEVDEAGSRRITLFDGKSTAQWEPRNSGGKLWRIKNGALEVLPGSRVGSNDLQTKRTFGDFKLHLEFQVPATPAGTPEQKRGNSGVYLQGRYEVQILDSYRQPLKGQNDAGAVYGVRNARRNASRPPGSWQTYEIVFRAPKYAGSRKVSNAFVTVYWNGVRVHYGTPIPRSTTLGAPEGPSRGPIRLQDHGSRVKYRNIWIEPLD